MRMTDAQRISVMMMVRDGTMSVDEAMQKVLATEEDLQKSQAVPGEVGSILCRSIGGCLGRAWATFPDASCSAALASRARGY